MMIWVEGSRTIETKSVDSNYTFVSSFGPLPSHQGVNTILGQHKITGWILTLKSSSNDSNDIRMIFSNA